MNAILILLHSHAHLKICMSVVMWSRAQLRRPQLLEFSDTKDQILLEFSD